MVASAVRTFRVVEVNALRPMRGSCQEICGPARDAAVRCSSDGARRPARTRAAFWLTLDAINFGSGWFPTLRKRPGQTGYRTIAAGIRRRFDERTGGGRRRS